MCGIFGAIGRSKNPQVSFDLLNSLFVKTEPRGTDASGFYGIYPGDGSVIFDKEPLKSSEYTVQRDIWNKTFKGAPDVDEFIGHCRQTSANVGSEKFNKNNHPHLSDDRKVAMVHNGKVPEFTALRNRYDLNSECDSEILLRMFESAAVITKDKEKELKEEFPTLTPFLAERLAGLKEIFSRVNYGAMAVAIAERGDDGQRYLWLFRDDERPLHVIDMRKTLGQIFFCSTADIWRNALDATPSVKDYVLPDHSIIEFPPLQIWLLNLDPSKEVEVEVKKGDKVVKEIEQGPDCWNIRKFKIGKTRYIDWKQEEEEDDKRNFRRGKDAPAIKAAMPVISRLGDNWEPIKVKSESKEKLVGDIIEAEIPDDEGLVEIDPAIPLALGVQVGASSKKKVVSKNTGTGSVGVKAKVQNKNSREPGDESEFETWNGAPFKVPGDTTTTTFTKDQILKNARPVNNEEINLTAFDEVLSKINTEVSKLSEEVHRRAEEKSISGRDFSMAMDRLEVIRVELTAAVNDIIHP